MQTEASNEIKLDFWLKTKMSIHEEPHLNITNNYLQEYQHLDNTKSALLKPIWKTLIQNSSNESFVSATTPVTTKPIFSRDYQVTKEMKIDKTNDLF